MANTLVLGLKLWTLKPRRQASSRVAWVTPVDFWLRSHENIVKASISTPAYFRCLETDFEPASTPALLFVAMAAPPELVRGFSDGCSLKRFHRSLHHRGD
jgi:hypothetical protein